MSTEPESLGWPDEAPRCQLCVHKFHGAKVCGVICSWEGFCQCEGARKPKQAGRRIRGDKGRWEVYDDN